MNKKARIIELDYLKGIGIFLVVLGHTILLQNALSTKYVILARFIYSFHIPLFFIASGIISGLQRNLQCNIVKTAKKLLIPYFFWSFVYIILFAIQNKVSLLERVYATITCRGIAPLWFLATLFVTKIFLSEYEKRIENFITSKVKRQILLILICLVLALALKVLVKNIQSPIICYPIISVARVFLATIFESMGYLIGLNWKSICQYKKAFFMISGLCFFIVQSITQNTVNMHTYTFDSLVIFIITGLTGTLFLLETCLMLPRNIKVLSEIGKSSMDIMILHYPPMPILKGCIIVGTLLKNDVVIVLITIMALFITFEIHKLFLEPIRKRYLL